jgi:hypothetical protein
VIPTTTEIAELTTIVEWMRAQGVLRLRRAEMEILLSVHDPRLPEPAAPKTRTEGETRADYYKRLLGREVDAKLLEQLP